MKYFRLLYANREIAAKRLEICFVLLALAGMAVTDPAYAASTRTWDGGAGGTGTSLSTAANWVGDTAPVAGDSMIFPTGFSVTLNNDFTAGTSFGQLTFSGGTYKITGNSMSLTTGIEVSGMTAPHEITAPLTMGADWTVTVDNSGAPNNIPFHLILSGAITGGNTRKITLTASTTGTGILEFANNNSATLAAAIDIAKGNLQASTDQALGTGTLTAAGPGSATLSTSFLKTSIATFDGNDTLVLEKSANPGSGVKDIFGIVGSAPNAGFFGYGRVSRDRTLHRTDAPPSTSGFAPPGTTIPADWLELDSDDISGLGSQGAWSLGNKPADLAFSEYVEGSGNNQAIEIFNDTVGGGPIDLGMAGTQNITLRRKASVVQGDFDGFTPPGDQIASEWDHFDTNTFSGLGSHTGQSGVADLFFSEYVEDSSGNNQALEIYNGTGASVDLSGYSIEIYANGSSTPTSTISLSGTLNNNNVFVVANAAATDATVLLEKDLLSAALANVNGNDAIVLRKGPNASDVLDTIGIVGDNPAAGYWGTLPRYTLEIYPDGTSSNPFVIDLSPGGTLANGSVLVVANPAATAGILAQADILDSDMGEMNGNDTVVLRKLGTAIDVFGVLGTNPSAGYFGTITVAAAGMQLRRNNQATLDVNGFNNAADISGDWAKVATPDTSSLGVAESFASVTAPAAADRVIFSEYVELGGNNRAIEISNLTGGGIDLGDYVLRIYKDGSALETGFIFPLAPAGTVLANGSVLVVGNVNASDTNISGLGSPHILDSQITSVTLDNPIVLTSNLTVVVEEKDTLRLNGAQSGAGLLNHINLGTLVLAGNNSARTGTTNLSGPVKFNTNNPFGTTGGTVSITGPAVLMEPLASPANLSVPNTIDLVNSNRQLLVRVASEDNLTFSGNVIGGGLLRKLGPVGAGQLTLTGTDNSFDGGLEIDDGTVAFNDATSLGAAANVVSIGGAATLEPMVDGLDVVNPIAFLPGSGAPKLTVDVGAASNLTLSGLVTGSGSLGISGTPNLGETAFPTAALTLSNANTFTKGVTLEGGNVVVGDSSALGTGKVQANSNARLSATSAVTLANKISITKILEVGGSSPNDITLSGVVDGSGILAKAGSHILTLSAVNAVSNEVRLGGGTLRAGNNLSFGTAKVLVGGDITLNASSPNVTLENDIGRLEPPMFDGNDTITLKDDTNAVVDRIGILANDPGVGYWGADPITTKDHLLKRKTTVASGDTSGFAAPGTTSAADISSEWDGFAPDSSSDFGTAPTVNAADLIFSEYIVGTAANDRCVEIFNGTGSGVDLGAGLYTVEIYTDGSNSSPLVIDLSGQGTLADGAVLVIADPAAAASILAVANVTDAKMTSVTGNDTLILKKNSGATTVDVFGILGNNPGAGGWGTAPVSSVAQTLRRRTDVTLDTNGFNDGANISDQWTAAGLDAFLGLDVHQKQSPATTTLLFSEYLEGFFDDQQLEIFNGTGSVVDLTGWKIEVAHDGAGSATATLDLSSFGQFGSGTAIALPTILATTHPAFTLTINGSNNLTLEGTITGKDLNIAKNGTGTLALNESNSYVGTTTFNTGTISIGKQVGALGDGDLFIGSTGTRMLTAVNPSPVQLKNSMHLDNPLTIDLASPNELEIRKAIVGTGSLTKAGTGTLTLSSTFGEASNAHVPPDSALIVTAKSTYSGGTTLRDGGRLIVEDDDALGTGGLTVALPGGGTLEAGAAYVKDATPLPDPISAPVALVLDNALTLNADLTVDGENDLTVNVSIGAGSGKLTKTGTGTLILPNSNSHSGGTTLADGGLLLGNNSALGSSTFTINGGSVGSSSGARTLSNALSLGGNFSVAGVGNITFSGTGALTADSSVEVNSGLLATFSNVLSGATFRLSQGAGSLGRLRLSGTNTFTSFTQAGGILEVDNNNAAGSTTGNLTISGGSVRAVNSPWTVVKGTINLGGNVTFDFFGSSQGLALNGPVTLDSSANLNMQNTQGVTFGGNIGGAGFALDLDLASTSRLTLNGACTYTGDTTIHGGILRMGASASLTSNVIVDPAGTFEGAGTVQDVTCAGILSPGGDGTIGQLTVDNMVFTAGSKFKVDVNGTTPANDKVVVVSPGIVSLGNQLCTLQGTQSGSSDNDAYVIVDNQGSSAISGIFNGIAEGGSVTLSGRSFGVFYDHLNGDDVALLDDRPPTGLDKAYDADMNPVDFIISGFRNTLNVDAANGVLNGVSDPDGDTFVAEILQEPTGNTSDVLLPFVLNADGSFSYTPEFGYAEVDHFTYVIRDEHGVISEVRTATITVNEVYPHVTGHPQDITVMATEIFSLTTDAVGTDPKSYQWFKGTSPNESNPVLFNASAQTATLIDQITVVGQYPFWCKVSNTVNGDPYFAYSIEAVVTVIPGPLDHFNVDGLPAQVRQNDPQAITVTAKDIFDNTLTDFTDAVTFTCDDTGATLDSGGGPATMPDSYTFLAGDNGAHDFTLTMTDLGLQQLHLLDTAPDPDITTDVDILVNNPPVFTLASPHLTATPNPATVNQTVTFNTGATDDEPLDWHWDFGDLSTPLDQTAVPSGATSAFHTFTPADTYTITVTATDSDGIIIQASIDLVVQAAIVGPNGEIDSDGDGWSDVIEIGALADPTDVTDTPDGSAPAPAPSGLTSVKLKIGLNFAKPLADKVQLKATMPTPAGFNPAFARVLVDVGGVVNDFISLNDKGSTPSGVLNSLKVKNTTKSGLTTVTMKLKNGSFQSQFADELLLNVDAVKSPRTVGVTIFLGGELMQVAQSMLYTAKVDKKGNAK